MLPKHLSHASFNASRCLYLGKHRGNPCLIFISRVLRETLRQKEGIPTIEEAWFGRFKAPTTADQTNAIADRSQPMPPYNPVLGHLPVVLNVLSKVPKDSYQQYLPGLLRQAFPELGPNFYLDTWPFGSPVLVISEPDALHQITQQHSLPKHPDLREIVRPIANGMDIVTMEGQTWKTWRNIFNPGFTSAHLMTLTPVIVKETLILCDILRSFDRCGQVFQMKRLTDPWTMDIIGKVVL